MNENDDDKGEEVIWVDIVITVHVEEHANKKGKRATVHQKPEEEIEGLELVREHLLVVLVGDAWVDNDAEGDEVAPLSKEQKHENANKVGVNKLIDTQIADQEEHDTEERLHLRPAFDYPLIQACAPDHLHGHQGDLEADPNLLDDITDAEVRPAILDWLHRLVGHASPHIFAHITNFKSTI